MVNIERDRIFVSIASYRDPEIKNTLNDMFAKATFKERVFAGVLSQIDPSTDLNLLVGRRRNVREMVVESSESKGCTWARSTILEQLRKDEEFVLQIDAHSRFDPGWDVTVLKEYASIGKHDCVITSYPPGFDVGKPLDLSPKHMFMKFRDVHTSGLPIFMADQCLSPFLLKAPPITPALSAGCLFGPSNIFDRVPYDPYVYFFGEEQSYAIRLFTHGIDLYNPVRTFMYHLYYNPGVDKKNLHWNDTSKKNTAGLTLDGVARVKYVLGMSDHFPEGNAEELNKYGLGGVRTVAQWEAFSGFNLATSEMTSMARIGNYRDLHK